MSTAKLFGSAFLAVIGLVLSAYSVYVEHRVEHDNDGPEDEKFQALCDIEVISASCSAVFSLPEGKMLSYFGIVSEGHALDIPNGVLGMLFYSYTLIRCFVDNRKGGALTLFAAPVNLLVSSLAIASSAFLARRLYDIRELCVLCLSTHVINTTLWIRAFREGRGSSSKAKAQ